MMLKKLTIYVVLAVLCPFLGLGQGAGTGAVDVTLKGLQIGQKVPEVMLSGLHNYKDAGGKSVSFAKLSDFRGKLLIIDFWATWCSPCVAMIPRMDSLQKVFGDRVAFLSVTYQSDKEVMPFLDLLEKQQGRKFDLPVLNGDKVLHGLFPHMYLPHYVWIGGNGEVLAITDADKVNDTAIKKVLSGEEFPFEIKRDPIPLSYSKDAPLFLGNNGGPGKKLIFHSLLSGYNPGIGSGSSYLSKPSAGQQITARNLNIKLLYRLAFSDKQTYFGDNRILFLVKDKSRLTNSSSGTSFLQWMANGNAYCYELIVPKELSNSAFGMMRRDLDQYFLNYKVQVEKIKKTCMVLIRTDSQDHLASKGGKPEFLIDKFGAKLINTSLSKFVQALDRYYMQNSVYPILDETGYLGSVDLQINFPKLNQEQINISLASYGLKFVLVEREIDHLVFRDNEIMDNVN